jgi:hypothetical protein
MDISGIHHSLSQLIYDYSENINYYNRNMRDLINIYERTINTSIQQNNSINNTSGNINISSSNSNSNVPSYPDISNNRRTYPQIPNRWGPFNSYTLNNPFGPIGVRIPINTMQYEDVVVRPTNEQINRATEIIRWDTSFSQTTCPISLEHFEPLQNICRIIHCGHMYNNDSLMHWFQTNVRCPVCRYDIREYNPYDLSLSEQVTNPSLVPYSESENETDTENENFADRINNDMLESDDIIYESTTYIRNYMDNNHNNDTNENNRTNQNNQSNENNRNNENITRNSYIRNNLTTFFRAFLTDELTTQIPLVNNSVNDFLYGLNIPVEFDISYSNLSTNPYNS